MTAPVSRTRILLAQLAVVLMLVFVAEAPRELVHNEAFNVGQTAENFRVREVADMVAELRKYGVGLVLARAEVGKDIVVGALASMWTSLRNAKREGQS